MLGRRVSNNESFWWIPGGSVEADESDFEAGLRELDEELFLTNDFIEALNKYKKTNTLPRVVEYVTPQAQNIIFLVPMVDFDSISLPTIKDEFEELSWFNLNELPSNMSREFAYIENQLDSIIRLL